MDRVTDGPLGQVIQAPSSAQVQGELEGAPDQWAEKAAPVFPGRKQAEGRDIRWAGRSVECR